MRMHGRSHLSPCASERVRGDMCGDMCVNVRVRVRKRSGVWSGKVFLAEQIGVSATTTGSPTASGRGRQGTHAERARHGVRGREARGRPRALARCRRRYGASQAVFWGEVWCRSPRAFLGRLGSFFGGVERLACEPFRGAKLGLRTAQRGPFLFT